MKRLVSLFVGMIFGFNLYAQSCTLNTEFDKFDTVYYITMIYQKDRMSEPKFYAALLRPDADCNINLGNL